MFPREVFTVNLVKKMIYHKHLYKISYILMKCSDAVKIEI